MLSTDLAQTDAFVGTGTAHCIAANRISFLFGLCGPSLSLDTACSSSLVTVHMACQSLRSGEADLALAGGVNIILSPLGTVNLTKAGFSAPDGRVRAFDAKASGYVRGEGAGMVVLKPLDAALRDGDPVYAVIRGSAVNQNGASNGLTAPSGLAQERIIREACAQAGVSPGQIGYVETQGTGTLLGDTIEALALGKVLREGRPAGRPCAIGSVKTSIGHLEAASGVASLMKAALALRHRELPASLHFETPNPSIPFAELPLKVQTRLAPWPSGEEPRLAGVSAFGFGGSNAHAVLAEPPEAPPPAVAHSLGLLPLSARTETGLRDLAARYLDFLREGAPPWSAVCATAAARREHHDCRLAVVADSPAAAVERLEDFLAGRERPEVLVGRKPWEHDPKVGFLFSGEVGAWASAVASLAAVPGVAAALADLDAPLRETAGLAAEAVLRDPAVWGQPRTALPSLVALQLALAAWWRQAGLRPRVAAGEGVGELAAAAMAGILSPEDALRLAAASAGGDVGQAVARLSHRQASLPFLSVADGRLYRGGELPTDHWLDCLEGGGDRNAAMASLADGRPDLWLHVGGEEGMAGALARIYAAGAAIDWSGIVPPGIAPVRLPTYPWQRQRLWVERGNWLAGAPPARAAAPVSMAEPLPAEPVVAQPVRPRPELVTPYEAPATLLEKALAASWSEVLRVEGVGLHDNFFELGGDSLQAMMLHNRLQESLGEVVQGYVLFQVQTVGELADYLRGHYAATVQRLYPGEPEVELPEAAPATQVIGDREIAQVRRLVDEFAPLPSTRRPARGRNPRAVFVLSPPRSGSTLLRVMLAGHDGLFAPPELELLGFATVAEQQGAYADVPGNWLAGLVRTVMEAASCGMEDARRTIGGWADAGIGVQEAYRWLQERIGERLLVDKTPSYSGRRQVLERAEEWFDSPLYIHLARHPCGMIRSYVEANLHEEMRIRFRLGGPSPFAPRQTAELVWTIAHQNIEQFLSGVPAERQHRLRFEDLVRQPEPAMRGICGFLGLEFQTEMILPYEHPERKMVDGVTVHDRMDGDQKFRFVHRSIDPRVADAWQEDMSGDFLGSPARELAARLGYDGLPEPSWSEDSGEGAIELAAPAADGREAESLLERLDELSDDEVAALLRAQLDRDGGTP